MMKKVEKYWGYLCNIRVFKGRFESCHPDKIDPYGMWRSLVAHTHGVRGVAGSNPVIPTT